MAAPNCSVAAPAPAAKGCPAEGLAILRFLTCGSVDDGKSTLIGRLLHDEGLIFEDTLAGLRADSRTFSSTGEEIDLALLVDGLEAEREQGITIDVAYRYFASKRRTFIVADTPGHEQYTRNMVTGASRSDLALLPGPNAPLPSRGHRGRARRRPAAAVCRAVGLPPER